MRIRSIILLAFWVAVFVWAGFNAMVMASTYFQTNDMVEQAFREASDRQRQRNPTELYSSDFAADLRTTVVTGARRAGLPVNSGSVRITPESGAVRVSLDWSYAVTVYGYDTGLAVPLWMNRTFDLQMGVRRFF